MHTGRPFVSWKQSTCVPDSEILIHLSTHYLALEAIPFKVASDSIALRVAKRPNTYANAIFCLHGGDSAKLSLEFLA